MNWINHVIWMVQNGHYARQNRPDLGRSNIAWVLSYMGFRFKFIYTCMCMWVYVKNESRKRAVMRGRRGVHESRWEFKGGQWNRRHGKRRREEVEGWRGAARGQWGKEISKWVNKNDIIIYIMKMLQWNLIICMPPINIFEKLKYKNLRGINLEIQEKPK